MRRLERLEGVAQVGVRGLRVPELQVNLEPARLQAHGLDVRSLVEALRASNVNVSAGDVRLGSRKLLVRAVGEFATPAEVREMPINATGLVLGDVAEVRYDFPLQEEFNYLNGVEALSMDVNKASTANLLAMIDRVRAELDLAIVLRRHIHLLGSTLRSRATEFKRDLVRAFLRNTKPWRSIFARTPVGWGRLARKRLKRVLEDTDTYVQTLNDRFTNPSGEDMVSVQNEPVRAPKAAEPAAPEAQPANDPPATRPDPLPQHPATGAAPPPATAVRWRRIRRPSRTRRLQWR